MQECTHRTLREKKENRSSLDAQDGDEPKEFAVREKVSEDGRLMWREMINNDEGDDDGIEESWEGMMLEDFGLKSAGEPEGDVVCKYPI